MTAVAMLPFEAAKEPNALPLRDYQRECLAEIEQALARGVHRQLVVMPTGCHRAGQHVLMVDGYTKPVEDVCVGDLLMGPDSTPREVLALARGEGPMMEIRPTKGDSWVVNDEHVLTLVETQHKSAGTFPSHRGGTVRDVVLPEWQNWSKTRKHRHKLFRVGVDFPARQAPPLDPYFQGVALGDASLSVAYRLSIATADPEVVETCESIAARYGLHVRVDGRNGIQHHITSGSKNMGRAGSNPIVKILRGLGLSPIACEDRFIPDAYRLGSPDVRREVLAGLIDSDGAFSNGGYDFGSKSERLARDVAFVSRSLGLAAYFSKRTNGHYRVSISGDCSIVPCRIARKIASPRVQKKDPLRTGFTVIPTGTIEPYYGFVLSGDRRYLLDDFTVTHNSGKTVTFAHLLIRRGGRALIVAHRDELIQQAVDKVRQIAPGLDVGVVKGQRDERDAQVVVASIQSLSQPKRLEKMGAAGFSTVIVDEAHHATATTYRTALEGLGCFRGDGPLTVGFTATAGRADKVGLGHVFEDIVFQRGILQMIAEGYLVDVKALEVTSDVDLGRVRVNGGDFSEAGLGAELERSQAIPAAALAYKRYAADRLGVAFTPTVDTAGLLAEELCGQGIPAEVVHGEMHITDRRAVLKRLHTGKTRVVCNCAVLTEGWDEPAVSCALMARPTKSVSLFTQMAGRPLRPFPGKTDALILDLAGTTENGLATIADLAGLPPDAVKPGESLADAADRMVREQQKAAAVRALAAKKVSLFRRSEMRWLPSGDAWVLPVGADRTMMLVPVADEQWDVYTHERGQAPKRECSRSLSLEFAFGVGEERARAHGGVLSRSDAKWRSHPPSPKQIETLRSMGYEARLGEVTTKGAASDLMTCHSAAKVIRKLRVSAR